MGFFFFYLFPCLKDELFLVLSNHILFFKEPALRIQFVKLDNHLRIHKKPRWLYKKKINQKVLNGNWKGFDNRLSGLHQLIFRELGLCEAEVAEKCQRLVTGLEEMEVIDISPLLFLSLLLSLSLQNMVRQYPLWRGTAKPRRVGCSSQEELGVQTKKGWVFTFERNFHTSLDLAL